MPPRSEKNSQNPGVAPLLQDPSSEMAQSTPKSFEQGLEELESIVKELEKGDLSLEDSITLFEKGIALSNACRQQLDDAESRVEILLRKGGKMVPETFDPAGSSSTKKLATAAPIPESATGNSIASDDDIPF